MFLSYWGIYGPLMFDFHPVSFAFPFLVWGIYLLQVRKKLGWASVLFVIATLAKEDVGILVGSIGVYWAIKERDWRPLLLTAYGFIFSLIGLFVLIPFFRGNASDTLTRYAIWGNSGGEIVKNILSNPVRTLQILSDELRITYLVRLLFPLGFLSLWAPGLFLVALPSILINLFSNFEPQLSLLHQYDVMATVGIFWAAMIGCKSFSTWWKKQTFSVPNPNWLFACLLALINLGLLAGHPIVPNLLAYPERRELYGVVQKLKTEIPQEDFVMTTNFVGAHFGTWQKLKILDREVSKLENWPDWIVIDLLEKNFWAKRQDELEFVLSRRNYSLFLDNPLLKVYRFSF